jgi:drug/metabolite transporter (DMT)-like permease
MRAAHAPTRAATLARDRAAWCCTPVMRSSPASILATASGERLVSALFVVTWSTGFITARLVAPHAEPLTFLTLRFAFAAAVLAAAAWLRRAAWPRGWRGWRDAAVAGVLIQGIALGCTFWAVHRGLPSGIAALVSSLQPLLTGLLAGPLLGEFVSRRRWAGIGLGFVGALLVLAPKVGAAGTGALPPAALAVGLVGMVSITLGTLWQKRTGGGPDLLTNAAVQFLGAAAVTGIGALAAEAGGFDATAPALFGLAWSVLALSVGSNMILLALIRRGAVSGVAALFFLVPAVSAAMALALFDERLDPVQILGMAVAVAGVALASRG